MEDAEHQLDRVIGHQFVVDDEQAKILRRIFRDYIDGRAVAAIARALRLAVTRLSPLTEELRRLFPGRRIDPIPRRAGSMADERTLPQIEQASRGITQ